MTKRVFLQGAICVLLILNVFELYELKKSYKLADQSSYFIEQLQSRISLKQQTIDEKDFIEIHELINLDANNHIDSVLMVEKSINRPLLVYRFSSNGCQSCIDSMLATIRTISDTLKSNILIISDNKIKNELYVRLHYGGLDQIKYAVSEKLSFSFDSFRIPYFFIIDNDMVVRMFFIPDKGNRKRTLVYFKYILNRYWSGP